MAGTKGEADGRKNTEEISVTAEAELRRIDSLNLEAGRVSMDAHKMGWRITLSLAFQSLGIVYGDIGTSPLYVYGSTFPYGIKHKDDILGVLSLIIYTILFIPMIKYVFIVLWANDNGNGGAFALYSLICRHIKMSLIPNEQPEDRELSNYKLETPSSQMKQAHKLKQKLEGSNVARVVLVLLAIMGTSMVIGDGILTPSISVLSAVSGISKSLGQDAVLGITIAILIVLFSIQRFGSEAMFADLGHFNVRAIQISFSFITCPSIVIAYIGQAAYLRKFPDNVANTFYECIPGPLYWPTFVVAVAAAIIASQAMISGAFSIISQALSLGCFPRVRVVHTSIKHHGQVYILEINYMFMITCIVVCAAFKTTEKISHAYDLAKFESELIQNLKAFIQEENYHMVEVEVEGSGNAIEQAAIVESSDKSEAHCSSSRIITNQSALASPDSIRSLGGSDTKLFANFLASSIHGAEEELKFIEKALEKEVVYMLAEAEVVAHPNSSIINKIIVNYVYSFFRKNFRQGQSSMAIPCKRLLKIGMSYEI
ncbi:hypothetical protein LR48_Vigan635s001100 [Vigna angularis]|uniref:K+ potassium transporter integral membrane domain-containing protein n=1 Tax=Phaseolus angularis TaxID=3914 RepID=A0A0L9TF91_PHAAN|nr:hypothetical protein LR48_Vigan635s001100 [Vigna angularis]